MAKRAEREKVIKLRTQGFSYAQIRKEVSVSKSTLSNWLADMPLSQERVRLLRDKNPKRIENFRMTMQKKKDVRFQGVAAKEKIKIGDLLPREIYLLGVALYWAEGTKSWGSQTELTNSDPMLVKMFIRWLLQEKVLSEKIKIRLHLYSDMDVQKEISFWSETLNIPIKQFRKPTIKKNTREKITYRGRHNHGTCQVIYGDRLLNDRIRAAIEHLRLLVS